MIYPIPIVIAEVGCSHLGDINRAKNLIKLAHQCGADIVKFQKRNPIESVPKHLQDKPHPNPHFSYGDTYLKHRLALELNIDQHKQLMEYCQSLGIEYSSSVWDITSAKEIIGLNPKFIKVPSAGNTYFDLLNLLLSEYKGDIHISTGMTTDKEKEDLIDFLKPHANRIIIYHCTSVYPCAFDNLNLLEIKNLVDKCWLTGMRIGFSNHGYGIAADIAAYTLGAQYIERHFIDDRTIRHTDAAASIEEVGLKKLCRDLRNVRKALKFKVGTLEKEEEQRNKLKILND